MRREEFVRSGEEEHVETISGPELGGELLEEIFGEVEREATHGTGNIDDEDEVALRDVGRADFYGWFELKEEGVLIV